TPAFAPRALAKSVEPSLATTAHALIDTFVARGSADLVSEFSIPMVTSVVTQLLNVSAIENPWIVDASNEMIEAAADTSNEELRIRYAGNIARLDEYFTYVIKQERVTPSGTLLTDMVAAEEDGDRLSFEELLATAELLVRAGLETTKRFIPGLI